MGAWQFLVYDQFGIKRGDSTAMSERSITIPVKGTSSAGFSIPITDPLYPIVTTQVQPYLVCLRDNVCRFAGPIISSEETVTNNEIVAKVVAAGGQYAFSKRWIPKSLTLPNGQGPVYGDYNNIANNTVPPKSLTLIMQDLLAEVNSNGTLASGPSGIVWDSTSDNVATTATYGPIVMKKMQDAYDELSAGVGTLEYLVKPLVPNEVASGGNFVPPTFGKLYVTSRIGQARPNTIFEYGTGEATLASYTRTVDRSTLVDSVYAFPPSYPNDARYDSGTPMHSFQVAQALRDPNSLLQTSSGGFYANSSFGVDVIDSDIQDDVLRARLAQLHTTYRANPLVKVTMTPRPNGTYTPFIDYDVGDTVRMRIVTNGTTVVLDGLVRIWSLGFSLDPNGNETVSIETVDGS